MRRSPHSGGQDVRTPKASRYRPTLYQNFAPSALGVPCGFASLFSSRCSGTTSNELTKTKEDKFIYLFAALFNGGNFGEIGRNVVGGECLNVHLDQAHKGTAKVRFGCTASIDNHADSGYNAAVRVHDIDRLLHPPAAGDDVFDDNKSLVGRNLKAAAQNEFAFVFLDKNVAFA